jgi:hypothetical protein
VYECNTSTHTWSASANGGGAAVGTANQINTSDGSGGFQASTVTADGSGNLVVPGTSTIAGSESVAGSLFVGAGTPNEGTTGTDLNGTAEFVNTAGAVQLKACATSKRYCFLVVKESSCGGGTGCTTGNAWVQGAFTETDTFSNTAVVGNWFKGSTTAAKQVEDTGTANTSQCPVGVTCLGFAMTAGSGAQTVVRTAPVIGPNSGAAQTNGIVFVGTPNTGVAMTGSELSLAEYKTDNTGIVNGTGVASSVFSAAGQCLEVDMVGGNGSSIATTYKLYYGGTSVTILTSGASSGTGIFTNYICTTTNTSTENIASAPGIYVTSNYAAAANTGVAVDGTTGQLIKITATAASGTVTAKNIFIKKLF